MTELSILENLNEEQRRAVVDTEGALLVLAGAGSGKTRVLTTRVAYLVKNMNVDPYNILAITFTNKAAGEMKQRVANMLGESCEVWISTFHSMCAQILFRECERIGYGKNFSIYAEAECARVLKRIMKSPSDADNEKNAKLFDTYYGHIKRIKSFNHDPKEYAEACIGESKIKKETLRLFDLYQAELKNNNAMDFDDLLINTVKLFDEIPTFWNAINAVSDISTLTSFRTPTKFNIALSDNLRKATVTYSSSATRTRVFTAGAVRKSAISLISKRISPMPKFINLNRIIAVRRTS